MLKTNIKQRGFTIVELLIVIVVIGILAALVLNTFAGVQERARDSERQTDTKSLSTQLEGYHTDHGAYPGLTDLQTQAWVDGNMEGVDLGSFKAPRSSAATFHSLVNSATPAEDQYGYVALPAGCGAPTDSAGAPTTPAGGECTSFQLVYTTEEDGTQVVIDSLNN